jgi:hypothetical protein
MPSGKCRFLENAIKELLVGSRQLGSTETASVVPSILSFPDPEILRTPPAM